MVRVNNITKKDGIECEVLAKCEFLNPGGAVKDRIGRRMILDAEKTGRIKQGDIIIEPTSGNTGMGLAMTAAARGYQMVITLPEKMSQEKQDCLTGLGATVIRTPTEYAFDHLYSHIGVAITLKEKLGDHAHVLDQYCNPSNPMVHYEETAEEIWEQCDHKLDYMFIGAGTGGTLTGISRRLKELDPNIQIVAIDPYGSVLAQPDSLNEVPAAEGGQIVEGIGYDFLPRVLDRTCTDHWIKAPDKETFVMARRLMKEEGFLCGGSSGTAMWGALKFIKENNIGKGKRCVVLLPDNIRNYITKHLSSDWMYEKGYIDEQECLALNTFPAEYGTNNDWGKELKASDLNLPETAFLSDDMKVRELLSLMNSSNTLAYVIHNKEKNKILGSVTKAHLMNKLVKNSVTMDTPISKVVIRDIRHVSGETTLNELNRVL